MAPVEATDNHSSPLLHTKIHASTTAQTDEHGRHHDTRALSPSANLLHPEDAFYTSSPLRSPQKGARRSSPLGRLDAAAAAAVALSPNDLSYAVTTSTSHSTSRRKRDGRRTRTSAKRPKEKWKKLLWVKQAYPDNYTDEETFLDQLKRNPRLRPYEFWSLVADSTIIVQHVASVIIFLCCFTAIFQERISPVTMVSWATMCTVLAWILRDYWAGQLLHSDLHSHSPDTATATGVTASNDLGLSGVGADTSHTAAQKSLTSTPASSPSQGQTTRFSTRNEERLSTVKSAILIYAALLGLSPILKSLTKSTSPDSIWAISSWLIVINVFTFDYGAGVETKVPASLSTNAALMASTVLASRLPSTTHVFSITLFSMEIFGLFPVFRRHLRHHSYRGHLILTAFLVFSASGGLFVTITGGAWTAGIIGVILGALLTGLIMGMTSWWLIGLQRYKNEIRGPWDPARPIIKRSWDG